MIVIKVEDGTVETFKKTDTEAMWEFLAKLHKHYIRFTLTYKP